MFALLPWRAVQAVGTAIGWLMWKAAQPLPRDSGASQSLTKCFPETWNPTARLKRLLGQQLDGHRQDVDRECVRLDLARAEARLTWCVRSRGWTCCKDALASGKGVSLGITSHLGNWEVLNHFYCSQCKPIIFYRPPKLKAVDELLRKQRVQLGNRVAASTKEGILSVIKEVRKGGSGRNSRRPGAR